MIKSEKEYQVIIHRMDEMLAVSENIENPATKGYVELNLLSEMVE